MTMLGSRRTLAFVILVVCAFSRPAAPAEDPADGDIRDLKVGVSVSDLPGEGYVWFACGRNGVARGEHIDGWADYRRCAPDERGWHEVSFKYDDSEQVWAAVNDNWKGTKLAGHPVVLSVLIDASGMVQGIRAVTNAQGVFEKKKVFLLEMRVKGRYGREGWTCIDQPAGDRTPVGGMFIDRTCEKRYADRQIQIHTALYRLPRQRGRVFTAEARLEILKAEG
jgi:hypothetical protein